MVLALRAPLSYREFCALPDDGHQYDLVEGIPIVNPAPKWIHQAVVQELIARLRLAMPAELVALAAPFDWVIRADAPALVRQPDVVVIPRERVESGEDELLEPPALVVEVVSPTSVERDLIAKRHDYAAGGCHHYWAVDPDEPSIIVFRLVDGAYMLIAQAVNEQEVRVSEPFPFATRPIDLVRPHR